MKYIVTYKISLDSVVHTATFDCAFAAHTFVEAIRDEFTVIFDKIEEA